MGLSWDMICKILFVEMFFSKKNLSSQERPGTGFAVFSFGCQSVGMKVQRRQLARVDDRLARKRRDGGNESCHVAIFNTKITNILRKQRTVCSRGEEDRMAISE